MNPLLEPWTGPFEAPPFDGCQRAFVTDPFGNRVELMEKSA